METMKLCFVLENENRPITSLGNMAAVTAGSLLLLTKPDSQVRMLADLVLLQLAEKETDLLHYIL